jgi:hypothetical protein
MPLAQWRLGTWRAFSRPTGGRLVALGSEIGVAVGGTVDVALAVAVGVGVAVSAGTGVGRLVGGGLCSPKREINPAMGS